jgi:hypothetical protein
MASKETRIQKRQRAAPGYKIRRVSGRRYLYHPRQPGRLSFDYTNIIVEVVGGPDKGFYDSDKGNQTNVSFMDGPFASLDGIMAHKALLKTATNEGNVTASAPIGPYGNRY